MKDFILTAISERAEKVIQAFNIQDKKAVITLFRENGLLCLKVAFKFPYSEFVRLDSAEFFVKKTMSDNHLQQEVDYKLVFNE